MNTAFDITLLLPALKQNQLVLIADELTNTTCIGKNTQTLSGDDKRLPGRSDLIRSLSISKYL